MGALLTAGEPQYLGVQKAARVLAEARGVSAIWFEAAWSMTRSNNALKLTRSARPIGAWPLQLSAGCSQVKDATLRP